MCWNFPFLSKHNDVQHKCYILADIPKRKLGEVYFNGDNIIILFKGVIIR